jgi:hypothetical protein
MPADAGLILQHTLKSIGAVCFLQARAKLKQERSVVHIAIHFVEACLTMYSSTFASLTGTRQKQARPLIQRWAAKMTHHMRITILIVSVVISGAAIAATPPPWLPPSAFSNNYTLQRKPVTHLKMGTLVVQLEETTLATVQKAIGHGTIEHQGDAGDSVYWLCYTIGDTKQNERIWVISHGEMGGSDHAVTGITAQFIAPTKAPDACPALPAAMRPLSFDSKVWLGQSETAALSALGKPSHTDNSWWSYAYRGLVPGKCEPDGYDILNWLAFEIRQGRIVMIHAGQVTSC